MSNQLNLLSCSKTHERGSATVTALIVVGVAAVLLAGLMWCQQIQIRTLENARDLVQAQWLQRAVIDFARLVLVEDQRNSQIDHLGEAWALPLADGKVADFLKNADVPDEIATVTLQGQLIDAQSQFNLTNLWDKSFKTINSLGVQEFGRLLDALGLDKNLAQLTAQGVLQTDMPIYDLDGLLRLPALRAVVYLQLMSVTDNLLLGAFPRFTGSRPKGDIKNDLEKSLETFPRLKERRNQLAGTLSGGEQQMLAMARAVMLNPEIILLDEPSMGLAPILIEEVFKSISNLKSQGVTMLLVEQFAAAALNVADYGYVLENGKIATHGPAAKLKDDPAVKAAYLGGAGGH